MGKKLIIKGADFSENGMLETVVTSDKSALYNYGGTQITAENLSSQTNSDRLEYFAAGYNGLTSEGTNNSTKFYGSMFEVGDYKKVIVNFADMPGANTGGQNPKYAFGIGFANENRRIIKVYGPSTSTASGDWYVKVDADYSGEITIPEGTKYIYVSDIIADATALAAHSVFLKKVIVE